MKNRHYLDYNATAPLRSQAKEAIIALLGSPLNASSVHGDGRDARKHMEIARGQVAELVGGEARGVTFTSSGTEANNTVLSPHMQIGSEKVVITKLLVSEIEHPCVLSGGRFAVENVTTFPVTSAGVVDLEALESILETYESAYKERAVSDSKDSKNSSLLEIPFLISIMLANNETGIIQPVRAIADRVHARGGLLHCDAVQAAGKIPINIYDLGVDVLTLSAHKIGGALGAGAIVRAHAGHAFPPLHKGGGQELGARGGTENVPAIAAFGAAAEVAQKDMNDDNVRVLRDQLEGELRVISNNIEIIGINEMRLPNTSCILLGDKSAETALISYDMAGVSVSSGSACSSGKVGASHVLTAMGYGEAQAHGAIRVSLGWNTTVEDITAFLEATKRIINK